MVLSSQQKGAAVFVVAAACLLFSCSTTQTVPRYTKRAVSASPSSQSTIILPEGWEDITSRSNVPSILLWIVNQDYSASMVLKEFHADDSSKNILLKEDACFTANISLRLKLADDSVQRRITRTPEVVSILGDACTYVYEEKGQLGRVIMYAKRNKIYELDLVQENSSKPFDELTADQIALIKELLKE